MVNSGAAKDGVSQNTSGVGLEVVGLSAEGHGDWLVDDSGLQSSVAIGSGVGVGGNGDVGGT